MNRRSFLRGLLALPFVGVAVKRTEQWRWIGAQPSGNLIPVGTIPRYESGAGQYDEIGGIQWDAWLEQGSYTVGYLGVDGTYKTDANRARFFGA